MSTFRYCEKCDTPMDKPTPIEDMINGQPCPGCGHLHFHYMTDAEWISDLWDEIQELKEAMGE